jgi:hypothetical protein
MISTICGALVVPATCGPKVKLLGETFKAFLGGAKHKGASDTTNIPTAKDRHFIGPPHSRRNACGRKHEEEFPQSPWPIKKTCLQPPDTTSLPYELALKVGRESEPVKRREVIFYERTARGSLSFRAPWKRIMGGFVAKVKQL